MILDECYVLQNGVKIPKLGLGTWQIPNGKDTYDAVSYALETGYRHIDTAAAYGNEESVGKAVRNSGIPREEIFSKYKTTVTGLNRNKVSERLKRDGKNVVIRDDEKSVLYFILNSFKDEFIIILLILAIINFCLGDHLGSVIIVAIAIVYITIMAITTVAIIISYNETIKQLIKLFACSFQKKWC